MFVCGCNLIASNKNWKVNKLKLFPLLFFVITKTKTHTKMEILCFLTTFGEQSFISRLLNEWWKASNQLKMFWELRWNFSRNANIQKQKKKMRGRSIESDEIFCFVAFIQFSFFFVSFRSQPQTKAVYELIWIFEFDYGCHWDNSRCATWKVWLESSIFNDVSINLDFDKCPKFEWQLSTNDDDLTIFHQIFPCFDIAQ